MCVPFYMCSVLTVSVFIRDWRLLEADVYSNPAFIRTCVSEPQAFSRGRCLFETQRLLEVLW